MAENLDAKQTLKEVVAYHNTTATKLFLGLARIAPLRIRVAGDSVVITSMMGKNDPDAIGYLSFPSSDRRFRKLFELERDESFDRFNRGLEIVPVQAASVQIHSPELPNWIFGISRPNRRTVLIEAHGLIAPQLETSSAKPDNLWNLLQKFNPRRIFGRSTH